MKNSIIEKARAAYKGESEDPSIQEMLHAYLWSDITAEDKRKAIRVLGLFLDVKFAIEKVTNADSSRQIIDELVDILYGN